MRIAFFTDTFPPTHDGVAQVTEALARALERRGHSVSVFTVALPGTPRQEERPDGIRVHRFASLPAPGYSQYRIALFPWARVGVRWADFDVAHIHTPGFVGLAGRWAAQRARIPMVGTYHTDLARMLQGAGRHRISRAFFRAWGRWSIDRCRGCDLSPAPTEPARASLLAPGRVALRRDPWVIGNGVDTALFRPGLRDPDWRSRWDLPEGPLITFLGRLTRDKGALRFLDAVERLDRKASWGAVLGGEGPQEASVVSRIADGGQASRVRYIGPVSESEKPALLSQTDVFVLPSLSDTSSVALLEAMACAAATVVTARGGPGEIARSSGAGWVVDPEDPRQLSEAIEGLLADPLLRRGHGERGRAWVTSHASIERMAAEFEDGYGSVRPPTSTGRTVRSGSGPEPSMAPR